MKFDSQLEESFYIRFNERNVKFQTSKKLYDLKAIRPLNKNVPYDISINIGSRILAIIELKNSQFFESFDFSRIEKFAFENNIRFVILSDGERFLVTEKGYTNHRALLSFNEFIEALIKYKIRDIETLKVQIADLIKNLIIKSEFRFLKEQIYNIFNQIVNAVEYDEIDQMFSFKNPTDIENIENRIFRLLLKDNKPLKKIFRYTTVNTLFAMLNYNSFRMNCLVGMNDTTEVNYTENYITGTNRDYTQAFWKTIDAYNRRFISSCSLKEDDLTQWRLYAEDSKGVCLVLNINEEHLNSKFILKRISYGKPGGIHPDLDLIKNIIAELKNKLNINFEFKTLSTWKHFFKPSDYAVEDEVRLLYILNEKEAPKGWVLTTSHGILNPYVEFKLNGDGLPFELTEIILGSKSPEKEINQKQFEQFVRELKRRKKKNIVDGVETEVDEYNLSKLKVSLSKIKNYR
ncbi:MAG: DUF2971 domain-containing protein [Bacteroidota bacterium]